MTRILIIRFSSIGDIVLTTPVVRALKSQLEGEVQIDFITKKVYAGLLSANPHINKVITIDKRVSEVKDQLVPGYYDYVVDLHNNLRSKQVKHTCKSLNFTIDKRNVAKWIYVNVKREILPIGHVVKRSFEAVKPLGVEDDGNGLDFFIPDDDVVMPAMLPEPFRDSYIAYAIGGKMKGKILPTDKMIRLCEKIKSPMILLGGVEDRERADEVVKVCGNRVFNACGAFSLNQSASIIERAEKVISHDTGLMHIAAALKKPLISLWFSTTPEIGFAPWQPGNGSVIIEANCKKRPTSKLGNRGFKDGCVFNVDLDEIAKMELG
ncbi:MAG: glycosyltransferase family 9 protein [Salibacteraceae bacterium]